ncbi:MAG TPA: PEP-CTERM sorting domain-containing protein [Casimicrobiaceae bacterium]|nr:PEP-CTERM sorting domain-containing protein [Casimicrobiaceae bacterium]
MVIRKLLVIGMVVAAPVVAYAFDDTDDTVAAVPEPATLALLGVGVAALVIARTNKRK